MLALSRSTLCLPFCPELLCCSDQPEVGSTPNLFVLAMVPLHIGVNETTNLLVVETALLFIDASSMKSSALAAHFKHNCLACSLPESRRKLGHHHHHHHQYSSTYTAGLSNSSRSEKKSRCHLNNEFLHVLHDCNCGRFVCRKQFLVGRPIII